VLFCSSVNRGGDMVAFRSAKRRSFAERKTTLAELLA
jgi:hypothetical protein